MSLLSFTKKIAGRAAQKETDRPAKSKRAAAAAAPKSDGATAVSLAAGVINLIPLVTEKSVAAQGNANTVAFRVVAGATKGQVMAAIVERYKIKPRSIRSMKMKPKTRRRGNTSGVTNTWKKMYVTLPPGATIDLSV